MITDSNLTHATSRSTMMSRPLKRGRACMNCRFLKIKCDGQKPICGPCRKHPKDDECEYSDGPARSRTKALEDTVSRLEARLHELEHPEDSTPSVKLFDPYSQFNAPPQLTISPPQSAFRSLPNTPYHQLPRLLSPSNSSPDSQGYTPLSPFSPPSTTASTPPFGTHGPASSPLGIFDSRGSVRSPESTASSLEYEPHGEALLQIFLPHASEFGFFLDSNRFIQSAMQSMLPDSSIRPSPALMYAVYMWGAHLSGTQREHEERKFKYKALQYAATDLMPSHPQSFLHTIQAEVLLSYYFFRTGHFLEARAHTATAVALALGGGLHQIRSLHYPEVPVIQVNPEHDIQLEPPADAIEEGERINGFWAVFMLQKNLSIALEPAARVCGVFEAGGMQIDTPWPLELEQYRQGLLTSDIQGNSTVRSYLDQPGAPSYHDEPSIIAMNVKACILLHRAVYIHGQWNPNVSNSLYTAFHAVNERINSLRAQLPDLAQLDGRSAARTILLTHSLLNAATIKLHSLYMTSDANSRHNCIVAARNMFRFGDMSLQGLGYLNPMMGTLWETACGVFVDELKRLREANRVWPSQAAAESEKEMYASLQDGLSALSTFAHDSLFMRRLLTKVQAAADAA
ncbi:hypothetical protein DFH07DRAFT_859675 [Mycena maculata]|uniref:Zn(2)-C6 fungal-type domain-containing protein n=1 Tax=Mycena maculata TaxID=230809 RepID=A0AAD7HG40_9AGAR|nr:hypothetical protein DFH07DRAFT_859675 [Mycena maculata]